MSGAPRAINRASTRGSLTRAAFLVAVIRVAVITDYLLAGLYIPQRKEQQVTTAQLQETIGFAGMIDILRRIAANAPIDAPISIKTTDINTLLPSHPPGDLTPGYPLANILCDLLSLAKVNRGKASLAVYGRLANLNSCRWLKFHAYLGCMWKVKPIVTPVG